MFNMSIFKNKKSINLPRISAFLFLALISCIQVYPFSHLHHFHKDDSLAFEVSYHPLDVTIVHPSAHHHEDERSSHKNDSHHKFGIQRDWNITRSQSAKNLSFDEQELFFSIAYLPPLDFEKVISFHKEHPFTKEHYSSLSIIRGPPLFG